MERSDSNPYFWKCIGSDMNSTTVNKILLFCCVSAGRRRLFYMKKKRFWSWNVAAGAFFIGKTRFWCWNVAAGAFFSSKYAILRPATC